MNADTLNTLAMAWGVYFLAVVSPGPATLAITGTAMARGRAAGMAMATGVLTGSYIWACLAALGMSAVLTRFAYALVILKVAGGCYLLWLGWKNFRSALKRDEDNVTEHSSGVATLRALYLKGLGIHLTNPKAVFVWLSLVSLGLPAHATPQTIAIFIGGAMVIGLISFNLLAIVFSTGPMMRGYRKARRGIEGFMAAFFALAGFKLLVTKL
jgi:threonine efflux protein